MHRVGQQNLQEMQAVMQQAVTPNLPHYLERHAEAALQKVAEPLVKQLVHRLLHEQKVTQSLPQTLATHDFDLRTMELEGKLMNLELVTSENRNQLLATNQVLKQAGEGFQRMKVQLEMVERQLTRNPQQALSDLQGLRSEVEVLLSRTQALEQQQQHMFTQTRSVEKFLSEKMEQEKHQLAHNLRLRLWVPIQRHDFPPKSFQRSGNSACSRK